MLILSLGYFFKTAVFGKLSFAEIGPYGSRILLALSGCKKFHGPTCKKPSVYFNSIWFTQDDIVAL